MSFVATLPGEGRRWIGHPTIVLGKCSFSMELSNEYNELSRDKSRSRCLVKRLCSTPETRTTLTVTGSLTNGAELTWSWTTPRTHGRSRMSLRFNTSREVAGFQAKTAGTYLFQVLGLGRTVHSQPYS